MTLHVEESFIRYCFNTRKTEEDVKYIEEDSNQFLKSEFDENDAQQNGSFLQKVKTYFFKPKESLNEDKYPLVRQKQLMCN